MANTQSLKEETLILDRDLRKLPVFAVGPDTDEQLPAVIIIHEIFAVDEHIKEIARRFAQQSMRAFAPDLFVPAPNFPQNPEQRKDLNLMRDVWSSIPDSQLLSDLQGIFGLVSTRPGVLPQSIGTIGYCMGGAIAFMFACSEPRLAWIADYYGRIKYGALSTNKPKHPLDYASNLKCPMLGIYAGRDELIPESDRRQLADKLEQDKKSFQIKVYEQAEHAFFNDRRPHFHKEAAQDAWQRTLDFIKEHSNCPSEP